MTKIEKYLLSKNIKPHYKGFKILARAIELVKKDNNYICNVTKMLYPTLAEEFGNSTFSVERAIRTVLSRAKIRLANSHFIAMAALTI